VDKDTCAVVVSKNKISLNDLYVPHWYDVHKYINDGVQLQMEPGCGQQLFVSMARYICLRWHGVIAKKGACRWTTVRKFELGARLLHQDSVCEKYLKQTYCSHLSIEASYDATSA
jgi:hypothetical protein